MADASSDRPRMRPIEAFPVPRREGTVYCFRDPGGGSEEILFLSETEAWIASRLDGTRDIGDIQVELCRMSGEIVPRERIASVIDRMEAACFLDSPAYRERLRIQEETFHRLAKRPAAHAGISYEADPESLAVWIDQTVAAADSRAPANPPRGLVAPHIDPHRGAAAYGSAYRAIRGSQARRIVILGISHSGGEIPFATIDKDFEIPLGDCAVDREFLEDLHAGLPFDPLSGRLLHRKEHSIEFQAIFLRRVLGDWSARRIVPILCCFPWLPVPLRGSLPYPQEWRVAFVERLASLLDEETLVVLGVDFAHVGCRFGDPHGRAADRKEAIEREDREMMARIADGDREGFLAVMEREQDARRICGYPAILTMLEAMPGARGRVLDYGQAIEEETDSLVSFGAIAMA